MDNNKMIKINKSKNNIINIFKKISYDKILAIIFIFFIFFVATATLPLAFEKLGKTFQEKDKALKSKMKSSLEALDKTYEGMLNFEDSYLKNKGTYINLNGLMARIMGQRVMNDVTLLNNGNLARIKRKKLNVEPQIDLITKLYNKQKEKNKHFLFVLAPSQISKYEDLIPEELMKGDYTNYNGDKLLEGLKKNKVPYIDLREEMYNDGIKHEDAFFKTDHHWNIETGFWAYTKIMDRLFKDNYISKIDEKHLDIKNYKVDIKRDIFLGSSGKRVGKYYARIDDFPIITPKSKINLRVEKENSLDEGEFKEVLYDYSKLKGEYFTETPYYFYSHGAKELKTYNKFALENKKVLMLGDSFSRIPFPFLSLHFKTMHKKDMRHKYENFHLYLEEFSPNILIVLIGENHIDSSIPKGFGKGL